MCKAAKGTGNSIDLLPCDGVYQAHTRPEEVNESLWPQSVSLSYTQDSLHWWRDIQRAEDSCWVGAILWGEWRKQPSSRTSWIAENAKQLWKRLREPTNRLRQKSKKQQGRKWSGEADGVGVVRPWLLLQGSLDQKIVEREALGSPTKEGWAKNHIHTHPPVPWG